MLITCFQFPTSPLVELMDLKYGKVRIVVVVDGTLGVKIFPNYQRLKKLPASLIASLPNILILLTVTLRKNGSAAIA